MIIIKSSNFITFIHKRLRAFIHSCNVCHQTSHCLCGPEQWCWARTQEPLAVTWLRRRMKTCGITGKRVLYLSYTLCFVCVGSHKHTHTSVDTTLRTHAYTQPHTHTHAYTQPHTHTRIHNPTHTHADTQPYTHL